MSCKDCIHWKACKALQHTWEKIEGTHYPLIAEKCKIFKDRSKFIELPCKVGDTVYIPQRKRVSVHKVSSIIIGVNNILCIEATPIIGYLVPCFFIDDIGNKVFLTEEEAEQALKREERENDKL